MARSGPGATAASTVGGTCVVMHSRGVCEISSGLFGGACAAIAGAGSKEQTPKQPSVRNETNSEWRILICHLSSLGVVPPGCPRVTAHLLDSVIVRLSLETPRRCVGVIEQRCPLTAVRRDGVCLLENTVLVDPQQARDGSTAAGAGRPVVVVGLVVVRHAVDRVGNRHDLLRARHTGGAVVVHIRGRGEENSLDVPDLKVQVPARGCRPRQVELERGRRRSSRRRWSGGPGRGRGARERWGRTRSWSR